MENLKIKRTITEDVVIKLPAFFKEKYFESYFAIFTESERFVIFGNGLSQLTEPIADTFKRNLEEVSKAQFLLHFEKSREATDKLFHSIDIINELDNTIQSELQDRGSEMRDVEIQVLTIENN